MFAFILSPPLLECLTLVVMNSKDTQRKDKFLFLYHFQFFPFLSEELNFSLVLFSVQLEELALAFPECRSAGNN